MTGDEAEATAQERANCTGERQWVGTCPSCEGWRRTLWMDKGKVKMLPCQVCDGEGTTIQMMGEQPHPPLASHIRLTRKSNKWIRS